MIKKSGSGSGLRIRDEKPGSYFRELRNHFRGLKYLNFLMQIRDPGWKNLDPGGKKFASGIRTSRIRSTEKCHESYLNTSLQWIGQTYYFQ